MATPPDTKWYDEGNLDELHSDLRLNYEKTNTAVTSRPGLMAHFGRCVECQEIKRLREQTPVTVAALHKTHRRKAIVISIETMSSLLGLSSDEEIVYMHAPSLNPNFIEVVYTGPDVPEIYVNTPASVHAAEVPA